MNAPSPSQTAQPPRPSLLWRLGLAAAFLGLLIVEWLLRLFSYRRVCALLVMTSPRPDASRADRARALAYGRLINKAGKRLPNITCLRRSLLVWWMLRWARLPSVLKIAVKHSGGTTSHSWVEHDGIVINDAPDIALLYPIVFSDVLNPEELARS
ncbi:MAG: hypothetical protein CUN53_04820 [Phototrophicales bacterium]|nr:MAG: hypothetical protein CUN53_04820 [Phototrophicales bacterium]